MRELEVAVLLRAGGPEEKARTGHTDEHEEENEVRRERCRRRGVGAMEQGDEAAADHDDRAGQRKTLAELDGPEGRVAQDADDADDRQHDEQVRQGTRPVDDVDLGDHEVADQREAEPGAGLVSVAALAHGERAVPVVHSSLHSVICREGAVVCGEIKN